MQSSPPTIEFSTEIESSLLDEFARFSVSQVILESHNPFLNSNVKQNTRPPNLEKSTSHSFSNSNLIKNPQQNFSDISHATMGLVSENLIPTSKESNSSKNPSTHPYHSPQHLGDDEIFSGSDSSSKNSKEMAFKNSNGDFSNCDIEMELSPNISEDSLGHIKTSLRSWKRLLRNSNPISSLEDNKKSLLHSHIKQPNSESSSLESPIHKKLAIEGDQLFFGGTIPPCHPP